MSDILDEAQAVVQCRTCPWYKTCVLPMRFTEEDLKKQLESAMPGTIIPGGTEYGMKQLLSGMAAAAQNTLLEGCPVFISRLRSTPKLAEKIKKFMQEWSSGTNEQHG
jgi:hypothetical protein